MQAARLLKRSRCLFRGSTKDAGLGTCGGCETCGGQAPLKVANCIAAVTGGQREVGRNSLSS